MTDSDLKAKTLAHCLELAKVDPDYALWAAGEYERMCPWCLANLQRKVEQEIRRSTSGRSSPVEGSTDAASQHPPLPR